MLKSKLGINLPPVADYYSGSRYYLDLVKMSKPAGSYSGIDDAAPGPLDAAGWPTGDHGRTLSPYGGPLVGTLRVIARGKVEAIAVRSSTDRATNLRYDAKSDTTTGELKISSDAVGVSLQVKGKGLGPMQVLRPGYTSAAKKFCRELTDIVKVFGFARYMDALNTNTTANDIVHWNDRAHVDDPTYAARGMPWEHAIDLSNATGTRPWLNLPYAADEDCAWRLAALVKDRLNPELVPIFEGDNEGWNTEFIQGKRNAAAAAEEVKSDAALRANPYGDPDGSPQMWAWARQAKRATWFNGILLGTFGSRDRYRLVANAQADSPQSFDVMLSYFRAIGVKPANVIHAVAIAPYPTMSKALLAMGEATTKDAIFAAGSLDLGATCNLATRTVQRLAAANGVRCWAYEGGINMEDRDWGTKVPALREAQSDPRMGDAVDRYLGNWDFAGGAFPDDRLFGYYTLQSPWLDGGPASNFGATDDVANVFGPKMFALIHNAAKHMIAA